MYSKRRRSSRNLGSEPRFVLILLCLSGVKNMTSKDLNEPTSHLSEPPHEVPMIFCRVEWMDWYDGTDHQWSHSTQYTRDLPEEKPYESYIFQPHEGRIYGWVRVARGGKIGIDNIVGMPLITGPTGDLAAEGVLVVWVAPRPGIGDVVVGWYEDATVYQQIQALTINDNPRIVNGDDEEFRIAAPAWNARRLDPSKRTLRVPTGQGGMGQSNIGYMRNNSKFRDEVLRHIEYWENHWQTYLTPPVGENQ